MNAHIQSGDIEPITILVVDNQRQPLGGLTDLKIRVRRRSDGYFLDWNDNTFKLPGFVSQLYETLVEVNNAVAVGEYHLNTATHVKGFDTSQITNPQADDIYTFTLIQQVGTNAANVPQIGELKVGYWIDHVDRNISDGTTPADISASLVAYGLDHLVSVNPGIVPPAAGTYIRKILDKLDEKPGYIVKQTFSYDQVADRLDAIVWVESGNLVMSSNLASCVVNWYDIAGNLLFSITDSSPDAQGFFRLQKSTPLLSADSIYYAVTEVSITGFGTISGGKGNFTF